MLIVNGRPEYFFCQQVIKAITELAGIGSITFGGSPISGGKTEIPIKNLFPAKHKFGWLMVHIVASSSKKVEIYETNHLKEGVPASWFEPINLTTSRLNLNLNPVERLVWDDKVKKTTKWELSPLYIILGHEMAHAMRWVQGKKGNEIPSFADSLIDKALYSRADKYSPYQGKVRLPDGKEVTLDLPIDDELVAMAVENILIAEARSRGAKISDIAVYGIGRNPKNKAIGHKKK